MTRIFLRFVLLVLLSVSLATLGIYATFRHLYGDPLEEVARQQSAGQLFLLEQYIDQAPNDEWLKRLNKVREVSEVGWDIVALQGVQKTLTPAQRELLTRGGVVVNVAQRSLYRRVDLGGARYIDSDQDVLHLHNLPIDVGRALWQEVIRFALLALFLLVPMAWWSRTHWQGLRDLSEVAQRFGRGNFDARATTSPRAAVYPLAERLNQMSERIQQLMEAQRSLLRSVSHELRTPIARLGFGLELLRNAANPQDQERRLLALEEDIAELNALVTELLHLTQLDAPQSLTFAPFGVEELLRNCAARAGQRTGCPPLQVGVPEGLGRVVGDARLLARAVDNLLSNACKYATTQVVLSAWRDAAGNLAIAVDDDGPGIPEDARQRIFEAFVRLEREPDHATTGFGLGLTIAHKAVILHGGTVTVQVSALGGARLTILLLAGEASERQLPPH